MNTASIGRTVRWARKRAGMTQHELARAVRMPQPSIARIERGTVIPRTATLIALLEATDHRLAVEPIGPAVDLGGIRQRLPLAVPMRTWRSLGKTARNPRTSPMRILRRLRRFGVPFVLIGELAEAAHGSPAHVGRVIEVVHGRTVVALERLALALDDLRSTKTDARRLRLVTETATGDDYDVLVRTAVRMPVDSGLLVRVAAIEDLVRIRLAGGMADDRQAVAVLRAIGELQEN
ncbi:MAG: helix-turn-helix domain-containing protein [Candidatus Limnocylindria bacterium]